MSKRWETTAWPGAFRQRHPSQKQAYERVIKLRHDYEQGWGRCNLVTVRVSEDKGPWQTYERVQFHRPATVESA